MCPYGILFHHTSEELLRLDSSNPIRHLATNLRHELNPILSYIVNQVVLLDPTASVKNIDTDSPPGRLLAAAVILDDTIQMITGVHDFHPLARVGQHAVPQDLAELMLNRFAMYSLLGGANRTRGLSIDFTASKQFKVGYARNVLEYLFSVIMDNIWKFAVPDSTVEVSITSVVRGLADISLTNLSEPLPEDLDLFALGAKASTQGRGFGYGLYWATLLMDRYSDGVTDGLPRAEVLHRQVRVSEAYSRQVFTLTNIRLEGDA